MPLPTTATLQYNVNPSGPMSANATLARVQGINLNASKQAMRDLFGITVTSDNTVLAASQTQRTIVFALNAAGSTFFTDFPGPAGFDAPFLDLFTHEIEAGAKMSVFESAPVIA